MTETLKRPRSIDQRLLGEPLEIDGRTVQPIAQVKGWRGQANETSWNGAGAWVRVRPVEVLVGEPDGSRLTVPIVDPERTALRGMALASLIIGIGGSLATLLARRRRARS